MSNLRNKLLLLSGALVSGITPFTALACSSDKINTVNYDLGLTTTPLNSLNYVLYNSVSVVRPSLVDTIIKSGPNKSLKSLFPPTELQFGVYGLTQNSSTLESFVKSGELDSNNTPSGSYFPLHDFDFITGTGISNPESAQPIRGLSTNNSKYITWTATLNDGKSRWSNGDIVTADDYIDYIHYLGDNNTGSQIQINMERRRIKGFSNFITAQNEYLNKFKVPYLNPWGYPKYKSDGKGGFIYDVNINTDGSDDADNAALWALQRGAELAEEEKPYVDAIRNAALNVGAYSGRLYFNISNKELFIALTDHKNDSFNLNKDVDILYVKQEDGSYNEVKLRKNPYVDPRQVFEIKNLTEAPETNEDARMIAKYLLFARDENELRIEYSEVSPRGLGEVADDWTRQFVPVNRSFIENVVGGVQNFGSDLNTFITNGPFEISELSLGGQGRMDLVKNQAYYNVEQTISNKIRIYFNDEQNTESAMFSDGYISKARIPSIQQRSYWSNPKFKHLMKKSTGFGTIGFMFNLDQETNKDSYINDKDLRSAIYYAINRQIMLVNSGWNNSYPVITWTAFGQAHKSNGTAIELGFDDKQMLPKGTNTPLPLQNYTYTDHMSKNFKFEYTDRKDKAYLPDVAKHYLEIFKKKHPNLEKVHLKYVYNSVEEQKNVGLALKNALNSTFGDFIDLELKALPENVYVSKVETGEFDIAYRNFDTFGTDIDSYIRAFFVEDGIVSEDQKTIGFKENPSGGFTYESYFKKLNEEKDLDSTSNLISLNEEETRQRLDIPLDVWLKVKELSVRKENETLTEFQDRYTAFFSLQFTEEEVEQKYNEDKVIEIVAAFEKIVRDAAPVIPLMEVDTFWEISRVGGVSSLYTYDLQYAYDINKPPRKNLPQVVEN